MTVYQVKAVDEGTLAILQDAVTWNADGTMCRITEQLAPKQYQQVSKVLSNFGGKWNKNVTKDWAADSRLPGNLGKGAIVFENDPRRDIGLVVDLGQMTVVKDGFYPTPDAVIELMADLVLPHPHEARVGLFLEPSAGGGHICDWLVANGFALPSSIHVCELNTARADALAIKGHPVRSYDFLALEPTPLYDYVFMNPPFEAGQDVKHILHAAEFLKPGGKLVAVASAGVVFREDKLHSDFREWLNERGAYMEALPTDSFKSSGTSVNAVVISI